MNISEHKLSGANVTFQESPNKSGKFGANLPDTIVMHYTAGASLAGSVSWLCNPDAKASAHVVVGREGNIVQLVPFDTIAWHAGTSAWNGRERLNNYSIGIELDNAGVLTKVGDQFETSFEAIVPAEQVMEGIHRNESQPRFWQTYTDIQLRVAEELCQLLLNTYSIKEIVGHEEISPGRKTDPGPAYPLDALRQKLFAGNGTNTTPPAIDPLVPSTGQVNARNGLNIRSGAGGTFETIAKPLPNGHSVQILEETNGWFRVSTTIEGWVHSDYILKTTT